MITQPFQPLTQRILAGLGCVTALAFGSALLAQNSAPPANRQRVINYEAESMRDQQSLTTLSGNVVITSDDSTLRTEKATYDRETQVATSPTRLKLDDKQNTVTGDKGVAYYSTRDVEITGNIVINARPNQSKNATAPKNSARRNFKDPVTITCTKVRYNWQTKKAVLTGNLTIKQKDRTITGTRGLYDGVAETVTLVGDVKSRSPRGESFDNPGPNARAVACFTEGKEYVETTKDPGMKEAKVKAVIPVREKEGGEVEPILPPDETTTPATAPETPPTPAPSPTPAAPPTGTPPQ